MKIIDDEIISIEDAGEQQVYDLVLKDNPHNFIANDIVVHNCGYGTIAYACAYFKTYYPKEYYATLLTHFPEKLDELLMDNSIKFLPPDVNYSRSKLAIEENGLRLPLTYLDGVGESVQQVIEENAPYSSFYDFETRMCRKPVKVKSNAVESLKEYGCFQSLDIPGRKTPESLKIMEWKTQLETYTTFDYVDVGAEAHVGGIVTEVRSTRTKTGKDMQLVYIRGIEKFTIMMFAPRVWTEPVGTIVIAKGKKLDDKFGSKTIVLNRYKRIEDINFPS